MCSQSPFDLSQLVRVLEVLKLCNFPDSRWSNLGLRLGLLKTTLDDIEEKYGLDTDRCLMECLSKWLSRADNLVGPPTWDSLSAALRAINENAVADNLNRELGMPIVNDCGNYLKLQERVRLLSKQNEQLMKENRALNSQIEMMRTLSVSDQSTVKSCSDQPEAALVKEKRNSSESSLEAVIDSSSRSRDLLELDYVLIESDGTISEPQDRQQQSLPTSSIEPATASSTTGKEHDFKLILLGDTNVGKSNFMSQFTRNEFKVKNASTRAMEIHTKSIMLDRNIINVVLWDTAGQERFRSITRSYYQGAAGALLLYDITRRSSYESVGQYWLQDLRGYADKNIIVMLIGNKRDLKQKRAVSTDEAKEFAEQHDLLFMETSAYDLTNVKAAFHSLLTKIYTVRQEMIGDGRLDADDIRIVSLQCPNQNITLRNGHKCCS